VFIDTTAGTVELKEDERDSVVHPSSFPIGLEDAGIDKLSHRTGEPSVAVSDPVVLEVMAIQPISSEEVTEPVTASERSKAMSKPDVVTLSTATVIKGIE